MHLDCEFLKFNRTKVHGSTFNVWACCAYENRCLLNQYYVGSWRAAGDVGPRSYVLEDRRDAQIAQHVKSGC